MHFRTKLLKNTNRKSYNLSNCTTFNDLEWPLTLISRFDIFRHWISEKRHEIVPSLLQNVNRKSYTLYRTLIPAPQIQLWCWHCAPYKCSYYYNFQWPWRTTNPVFKVRTRCILGRKLLTNTNRKPYAVYRMVPLWVTSDPDFKITTFFDIEYIRNDTR